MKLNTVKVLILIVCAIVLVAVISSDISDNAAFSHGINTGAAMRAYPPDTVMLSSGDITVTWGLFYVFLHNTAAQVTDGFREPAEWSEPFYEGSLLSDIVIDYAVDQAIQYMLYEYGAAVSDISLSDDELENFRFLLDMQIAESGGAEEFLRLLQDDGFLNIAVYEQWAENYLLQEKLPAELYGQSYLEISDELVADYAARNGYMLAKHILLLSPTESDGYTAQEIEDGKKAVRENLEGIFAQLESRKNDADFITYFSSLAAEHSEDPGNIDFPDGYLFQFPDMVEPFSAACEALGYGQMSGIVETPYGYHIILRLPLDYDNIVPIGFAGSGQDYTLRQLAVFDDYENRMFSWLDAMPVVFSPELEALDVAELFAWHE